MGIQGLGGYWMSHFDINVSDFDVFWSHYLMGLGQSVAFTPMAVMAFKTLPRDQITDGSAVFTMMRNFGSSLFISMAVMMLVRSTSINYAQLMEFVNPYRSALMFSSLPLAWSPETATGLMSIANEVRRQAAMIGYVNAFHMMAFTGAISVPLAFFMRNPRPGAG